MEKDGLNRNHRLIMIGLSLEQINAQSPYEVSYAPNGDFVFATDLGIHYLILRIRLKHWQKASHSDSQNQISLFCPEPDTVLLILWFFYRNPCDDISWCLFNTKHTSSPLYLCDRAMMVLGERQIIVKFYWKTWKLQKYSIYLQQRKNKRDNESSI